MKKNFICVTMSVILVLTLFAVQMPVMAQENGNSMKNSETGEDILGSEAVSITQCDLSFKSSNYKYTGKEVTPVPVISYNDVKLTAGTDFDIVGYENNIYPGKAKVTVTGKGSYKDTVDVFFSIAKVSGLKSSDIKTDSVTLKWNRLSNVTGYKVYSYSVSKKSWVRKKTVVGYSNTSCVINKLSAGYGYMFKVRAYVKDADGTIHNGEYSDILKTPVKPGTVTISKAYSSHSLNAWVKWNKKTGSGYQVKLSRKTDYSNAITYTIKSSSTLSKKTGKLKDNKTYYAKVRAYRTYSGKTVYGAWSKSKSFKTDGTGWVTSGGKKYYYTKGNKAYGTKTIGGNKYYFRTDNGAMSGASYTMWKKVRNQSSGTEYLISTSRDLNRTCVYYGSKGNWTLKYYWNCTTGMSSKRTPKGNFSTPKEKPKLRYMGHVGSYTCWYATRFYKRCYYHSVLFNYMSPTSIQDGRLGGNFSNGCVRLAKNNAKWLYDNIEPGTKVVVY